MCSYSDFSPHTFLLCDSQNSLDDNINASAILATTFYNMLNKLWHGMRRAVNFNEQFDMFVDEAVQGHSNACYDLVKIRRM